MKFEAGPHTCTVSARAKEPATPLVARGSPVGSRAVRRAAQCTDRRASPCAGPQGDHSPSNVVESMPSKQLQKLKLTVSHSSRWRSPPLLSFPFVHRLMMGREKTKHFQAAVQHGTTHNILPCCSCEGFLRVNRLGWNSRWVEHRGQRRAGHQPMKRSGGLGRSDTWLPGWAGAIQPSQEPPAHHTAGDSQRCTRYTLRCEEGLMRWKG